MYKKLRLVEAINTKLNEAPADEEEIDLEQPVEDMPTDTEEEMQDVVDTEDTQEENPIEQEEEHSLLDTQLDEIRAVLPDLGLSLLQLIDKEDTNNITYIIGKVAEDNNEVLMLVDTKSQDTEEDNDIEDKPIADTIDVGDDQETELESRYDYVVLPKKLEEINTLAPRYGDELTPDHDSLMEYLMNCLIEINPDAVEDIENDGAEEDAEAPIEDTEDVEAEGDLDLGFGLKDDEEEEEY